VETVGKALLALALLTAVVGGTLVLLAHFGMNRLPGDVVIRTRT
jgi:hypothetical protein